MSKITKSMMTWAPVAVALVALTAARTQAGSAAEDLAGAQGAVSAKLDGTAVYPADSRIKDLLQRGKAPGARPLELPLERRQPGVMDCVYPLVWDPVEGCVLPRRRPSMPRLVSSLAAPTAFAYQSAVFFGIGPTREEKRKAAVSAGGCGATATKCAERIAKEAASNPEAIKEGVREARRAGPTGDDGPTGWINRAAKKVATEAGEWASGKRGSKEKKNRRDED